MALGLTQKAYRGFHEEWVEGDHISTADANGIKWLVSSDTGDTAFAVTATADGALGRGVTAATDDNMAEIGHHLLSWTVEPGKLMMEARCRVQSGGVGDVAFSVGFTDDALEDTNNLPVSLSTTTFTSNASTFIGVVYDTDATNDDFHAFWVDDDTDTSTAIATLRYTGLAPAANQWFGVRIVLDRSGRAATGSARAEITVVEESTGQMAQKVFDLTIDNDADLTPHIAFQNRAAAAHTFDIDYIEVMQARA